MTRQAIHIDLLLMAAMSPTVELLGGEISAESEVTRGTTFRVQLGATEK